MKASTLTRFCLVLLSLALLMACAGKPPAVVPAENPKVPLDRSFARLLSIGQADMALKMADSLGTSKDQGERELAAYWKTMAWLYKDQPDSALAILESAKGKWKGGMRLVHAEAFLHLTREASQARAITKLRHDDAIKASQDKVYQDKLDAVQKENGDLRAEVSRLETEKEKYEKLLKDLETIR